MPDQITKETFEKALREMGHNPDQYRGKRLTLSNLCELYELKQETVIQAIDDDLVCAHYDYRLDTIWIDALDAAHYYYCMQAKESLFNHSQIKNI